MSKNQDFVNRAQTLAVNIIRFTRTLPKSREYWIITDQLIRSSCSIGANMTEANSASSKKDYINFYNHALKSANETIYWLSMLKELLPNTNKIDELDNETEQLCKILAKSIITMKKGLKNQI
jgi:four helix bundle protein